MAIFENKKKGHSRIIKLFGNVIYITTSGYKRRTQRFLGNIISTQKICDENDNETKITKIFDHVISRRETDEYYRKTYFLGKLISSIDLNKKFIRKYKKYINGYENIIIIHSNSGEAYLFLTYVLDAFLRKNNINKNVLLVATKKYHIDLINLLCPEIPHCYIKKMKIFRKNHININGQNFYMAFTGQHFIQTEKDIKNNPLDTAHYFYSIIDELGIKKEELGFRQVKISEDLKNGAITKARKIGLNLDKFVFIAPEAASCEEYDNEFWVDLCNELQQNGYDIIASILLSFTWYVLGQGSHNPADVLIVFYIEISIFIFITFGYFILTPIAAISTKNILQNKPLTKLQKFSAVTFPIITVPLYLYLIFKSNFGLGLSIIKFFIGLQ